MNRTSIDALIARLANDPAFAAALGAAPTAQAAQRIAAEHGFDVTPEQLAAATTNRDLPDADLAAVSGGGPSGIPGGLLD